MKRKLLSVLLVLMLVLVLGMVTAAPVTAAKGGNGAYRGEAVDTRNLQLGTIKYLATPAGFHFWFTPTANIGPYLADHSYHNVYQVTVDDPSEWMGPIPVGGNPPRPPYNQVGHEGKSVYYKIFDTTTDTQVLPSN